MNVKNQPFSEKEISITLKGEEWFSLLVKLIHGNTGLSKSGRRCYESAKATLQEKLKEAS